MTIVAIGTYGAREALRMVIALAAARATSEVLAVVLADFHQEVYGYAKRLRRLLGERVRVITPAAMPPGAGQGFMHKMDHDRRTQEIWDRELTRMATQLRRLNAANGSTVTTLYYILPPWSGHVPIAVRLVELLKAIFRKPVLHIGHINLPSVLEPDLRRNWSLRPQYPASLGLDGLVVSEEDLDPHREIHDWTIAAGLAGLFAANRVDPAQQHGANPLHSLLEFAKSSGGLVGLGVGQGAIPLIPTFLGLRRDIPEQDLPIAVANVIDEAFTRKAWSAAPDCSALVPHFVSTVVPLDPAHYQWRNNGTLHARLRVEAIKDLPNGQLPDGCTVIWTAAAIDSGTKDSAPIFALWLYPVADTGVSITAPPAG